MKSHLLHILCIACWFMLSAPVWAQNVYRCGDNSYSQTPCAGGVIVERRDARDAAQRAQADASTERQKKSARALEQERLKQEAAAQARQKSSAPTSKPATPNKPASEKPEKYFTAKEPRPIKDKPHSDGSAAIKPKPP